METWLLILIISISVIVVGVVVWMLFFSAEEEAAAEVEIASLDDKKTLDALTKDGLKLMKGDKKFMSISDDGAEGFSWILDTDSCKGVADFEVLPGKPGAEPAKEEKAEEGGDEKAEEGDAKEGEEKEGGDEKKEEKPAEKPLTYMSATAVGDGSCT